MTRLIIAGITLLVVQGCSVFAQPKAQPVIEDRVTDAGWGKVKIGLLATTPERRMIVVKMPDNRFCAEPPADAADNVAAALSAAAKAKGTGKLTEGQVGAAQTLATSVKQLFKRTQGVQLYRDGTFMLCNAYLNGAITSAEFVTRHVALLEAASRLAEKEVAEMYKYLPAAEVAETAPTTPPAPDPLSSVRSSPAEQSAQSGEDEKTGKP
jgi:hypothetical protein